MEYSQIILNYMESHGVTGYRLAKYTGISESLFGKWRNNPTSKIDATTLTKISKYFDIPIDTLLGNEQKNKPSTEVEGLSPEAIMLSNRIGRLSPANRAKLSELIDLYLSAQDKTK